LYLVKKLQRKRNEDVFPLNDLKLVIHCASPIYIQYFKLIIHNGDLIPSWAPFLYTVFCLLI